MTVKKQSASLLHVILFSFFGVSLCLVLLVVLDITTTLGRHFRPEMASQSTKNCSWIKLSPVAWDCLDNWDSGHRVVTAFYGDRQMKLEMSPLFYSLPTQSCKASFPYSILPYHPSASGLSFPSLCWTDDGVVAISEWDQDSWSFRFSGINVTRDLYLDNLAVIGRNAPMK